MATTRVTDRAGQVLGGRYRLVAPIGTGASATVYLAEDTTLRRPVAVKVLHDALADDDAFVRRFEAEARAAAALNHPHITSVFDWSHGTDGEVAYLVMEHVSGGNLKSILDRGERLSLSQALLVGLEASRGLDYAHRRGFVHRDIKPANLLFDEEGRLRIADFGLARALAEAAWTEPMGAVLGTARYASPEQARGESLDGRSDVYSLALVVIEAVTGTVPFSSDTTLGTLMARVDKPLQVASELEPLRPVLEAAGVVDPAERIDAHTFGRRLLAVAEELPPPAPLPLVHEVAAPVEPPDQDDITVVVGGVGSAAPDVAALGVLGATIADTDLGGGPAGGGGPLSDGVPSSGTEPVEAGATVVLDAVAEPPPLSRAERRAARRHAERAERPSRATKVPRRRGRTVAIVVVVLALLAAAGGGAAYGYHLWQHPDVPDLVGGQLAEAEAAAEQGEWRLEVTERYDETATPGVVLDQQPSAGERLERGEALAVVVSLGPEPIPVPTDLVGLDRAEAEARILAARLTVGTVLEVFDEDVPTGEVLAVGIGTPAELPPGGGVDLVVSKGPEPRTIPGDLLGVPRARVVERLEDLGLAVVVVEAYNDDVDEGLVYWIEPEPGAQVPRGDTVRVGVSLGPELVRVPDVRGMTVFEATEAIEAAGLVVEGTSGSPVRSVTATSPTAGTEVRPGTGVTIITRGAD